MTAYEATRPMVAIRNLSSARYIELVDRKA
jgi:hypothetical protein